MAGKKRVPARMKAKVEIKPQGFTKKEWITMGIVVAAIALVILGYFLLRDYFDGSLRTQGGKVQAEDNWIVVNTGTTDKPKYFKLGTVSPVDGYTMKNEHFSGDDNVPTFYYTPDAKSAIENVTLMSAKGTAEELAAKVSANFSSYLQKAVVSEVTQVTVGDRSGWSFSCDYEDQQVAETAATPAPEATAAADAATVAPEATPAADATVAPEATPAATPAPVVKAARVVYVYINASHDMSVSASITAKADEAAQLPSVDDLYKTMVPFVQGMTVDGEVAATAAPAASDVAASSDAVATAAPTEAAAIAEATVAAAIIAPAAEVTAAPTEAAAAAEVTAAPTEAAATAEATVAPAAEVTAAPTEAAVTSKEAVAAEPTVAPTAEPTAEPTVAPTAEPTVAPTAEPTVVPTAEPTVAPTVAPTAVPTVAPTAEPTAAPTVAPTAEPTVAPTAEPTVAPTAEPTVVPTAEPTVAPTAEPTVAPTVEPTAEPTPVPESALPMVDGKVAEENWILVNSGTQDQPAYVKLGEVQAVDGYTMQAEKSDNDENTPNFFYYPEGDSQVADVRVLAAYHGAQESAEKASKGYGAYFKNAVSSEVTQVEVAGRTGWAFSCDYENAFIAEATPAPDATPAAPVGLIRVYSVYFDAPNGLSVVVSVTTKPGDASALPDAQTLSKLAEPFVQMLAIEGDIAAAPAEATVAPTVAPAEATVAPTAAPAEATVAPTATPVAAN